MQAFIFISDRWPRLSHLLFQECKPADDNGVNDQDNRSCQWLMFAYERMMATEKTRTELFSMSTVSYPHGEPPLALMEALVSSCDFSVLEDELLDIIFDYEE